MVTDETANYRWTVESPANRAKRAEKTLDDAMEATKPPRKWYGGTAPRAADAFEKHEKTLEKAMNEMTSDDLKALGNAANKRAGLITSDPHDAADRRLMTGIHDAATETLAHRQNRTIADMDDLVSLRDPALQRKATEGMDVDRLRLLNHRANGVGSNAVDTVTRRACNTVNDVAAGRIGHISGHTRNHDDRIPSPTEREQRLTNDIMKTSDTDKYLYEATPKERKNIKEALVSQSKDAQERDKRQMSWKLKSVEKAIDQGPGFRPDHPRMAKPFATQEQGGMPEKRVTRGAGRIAGGQIAARAPAPSRPEHAAAR